MELTKNQERIMNVDGHLLVTGGPGSGKTTVSILKAAGIAANNLGTGQKVLFLSFARATVSRVVEAIEYEQKIPPEQKRQIDVETYHSFFWRILKAHGYLTGLPRRLSILTPPNEAIALSEIRNGFSSNSDKSDEKRAERAALENIELERLAIEEGKICFDHFAPRVGGVLEGSERIRRLISTMYPYIVLDEFQDTNAEQWRVVQALGEFCTLIALADPEQRIYDFIGADPERLNHFRDEYDHIEIDLSTDNHRSAGTDIATFGNDVLTGRFTKESYTGINCCGFDPYGGSAMTALVTATYNARTRLINSGKEDWSLAVLVPTKKMTRLVSDKFRAPPAQMSAIHHSAIVELEAAILGAELISFLMQPGAGDVDFKQFIALLISYFLGKGGDTPTQGDINEGNSIQKAYDEWIDRKSQGKAIRRNSKLVPMLAVYEASKTLTLKGDPESDWRAIRSELENGACPRLRGLSEEVRNIRLLDRGTQLRQSLSQNWRDHGVYADALKITRQAFVQEHFATSSKPETGVVVMNMHKAKGKQFDEVIIFEGWPRYANRKIVANFDRIVRGNDRAQITDQARQNFRVSVTRGKQMTTILTPKTDPCVLLV